MDRNVCKARTGIISAQENEVSLLLARADIDRVERIGGVDYHIGTLCGREVVICRAGIGKAYSAAGAAVMMSRFPLSSLLFTGIAGGVGDQTKVLDMVIATELVHHDYGAIHEDGFTWTTPIDGGTGHFTCDPALVETAFNAAVAVVGEGHVFRGLVASGDQFVASESYVNSLREKFGAIACEMEGACVASVAARFGVPFVVIRAMSDKADGKAHESYENLGDLAADHSGRIVMEILKHLPA